ncbi:unnamed protein product [Rhizoctonia solani]|uniref:DUF6535 domain-containing protein n=1 Tax=Rhizoctonia solani TaxID=456999 RepID=A0A8H3GZV2_9AGAM|nr:unnamed protein product [Rhizoctonia solani]
MSLLIPTNLSGSGPKGKTRIEANGPGVNVTSSSDQANINDDPRNIDQSTEAKIQPDPFQQAPSKTHQIDDPWSVRDEYGAELTKDARVWKVYVKEADKSDTELVDGWNKSLDVILVFAALFSAVSTAFLIESSKMLKQDPNDVSAAALVVMSRALVALTSNSSVDLSSLSMPDQSPSSPFVPAHNAVLINTLWYLSLATSVATSFLAMLAKDWCRSFETGRSGHPYDQAQRRQRKWMMIERWKMQELIVVLPSLIHISLLLFAIGLCIYVWDLDVTTTIPVISTAVALQAIAGAASNIPLDPLKDCDASFKILQRLVSGGSGPTAAYDASLYARALSALTTLSQFNSEKASTSTEDLAVMIWNLKLQYEQ